MDGVAYLTPENLTNGLTIFVAICIVINIFANAIKAVRNIMEPKRKKAVSLEERQDECGRRFERDYTRLNTHDQRISRVEEGQRMLCSGVHALLEHELHNGNAKEMQDASKNLFDYMNSK